ncbi:MAG: AbrB/MazE/SpoVT family DNA-binding domain-containing protein [Treponema sp.]|jgi:antitoxin PrlF|nr:AbrB/MazE/SpoVT family DNA-binding domain-containing protein [Treponema sp.]
MKRKTEVTALSSKGQIVLPKTLRDAMSLETGCKFIILTDGENILLKPVQEPNIKEFDKLIKESHAWAKKVGMKESDISAAIKTVRSRH